MGQAHLIDAVRIKDRNDKHTHVSVARLHEGLVGGEGGGQEGLVSEGLVGGEGGGQEGLVVA